MTTSKARVKGTKYRAEFNNGWPLDSAPDDQLEQWAADPDWRREGPVPHILGRTTGQTRHPRTRTPKSHSCAAGGMADSRGRQARGSAE